MDFTIIESSVITFGLIILIVLLYFLMKYLTNKFISTENRKAVIATYMVFSLLLLVIVYFGFVFWNTTIFDILNVDIDTFISFLEAKVGALISTVLIAFLGFGFVKLIKIILEHSQNSKTVKNAKRGKTILKLITSLLDYTLKIIILLIILSIWGVNIFPAIAGLGILGLVIGFGAQDLMKDFIAGFFIIFEKHFDVGDIVEINGFKGEVIDIGLKTTKVMNWKKDVKIFNNASVQNAINYSFTESIAIVEVGVSYDADISSIIDLLNTELAKSKEQYPDILENPTCLGVTNFSSSSIDLRIIARTATEKHYGVERILRNEIKKIFDQHNIEIPFTQIVLHQTQMHHKEE